MQPLLLRVPAIWGSVDRIAARPDIAFHENAVYLPADGSTGHRLAHETAYTGSVTTAPEALYILLDDMTGHYGHFITDVLSRLWPLLDTTDGAVRIVCPSQHGQAAWARHSFVGEILAGLGLSFEAVVSFERPVVLPRAAVAAPSFRSLECFHEVFADLCRRVGHPYWDPAEVDSIARPIWLAKTRLTSGVHRLVNEAEIVDELDRLGVDILYPETMRFSEQVRLFARRRVLMGPVGSAFHTAAFSAPARRTIGLSGMLHLNSNYLMFDAIAGNRAHYYYVSGMQHGSRDGFGLAYTVPKPKEVAAALLERAERFDRIDALDAVSVTDQAGPSRSSRGWVRRVRGFVEAGLQRARSHRRPR